MIEENYRLKESLMSINYNLRKQLEFSDLFKRNTEITLIALKEEFSNLVLVKFNS